jgi:F-type H+-transporting ATPase subunit epsilon
MAATFRVKLLTAERTVLERGIVSLQAPGTEGFLGVLAHHAPLITSLKAGPLILRGAEGAIEAFALSGGILEVADNQATVLADSIERAAEIDVPRARAARERTRDTDIARAEAALGRAINRLRIAERHGGRT